MKRLNPILKQVQPSATIVINELSNELISQGRVIYKLGFGQSPFPVPIKIVDSLKNNAHQKDYLPTKGLDILRQEIAQFYNLNYNLNFDKDNIILGPGSKELLYGFQLAYDFEELLLPSPSWVSYEPQALLTNRKVVWLPTSESNDWKITSNVLIDYCRKNPDTVKVLILNYPSNPLGITYSKTELRDLSETLRKFNIIVISDEIYGEVDHNGTHNTIAKYYPEGTIISSGLSKWAGAGGWRFGIFVFPKQLRYLLNAMATIASETFTSVSAPIQYAAVEAYRKHESIEIYKINCRKILKSVAHFVYDELSGAGITMPKPQGGFYLFPNFEHWRNGLKNKNISSSSDLCSVLLNETGVALLPGAAFGVPENHLTARLSYVDFDGEKLLSIINDEPHLSLDHEFVRTNCPRISAATQKIISWVSSL